MQKALKGAVHEACIAIVVQPCPMVVQSCPMVKGLWP